MFDEGSRGLVDITPQGDASTSIVPKSGNLIPQQIPPAVAARLAGLQRLPELTLDEVAHAQECYHAVTGEQKECISNTFELRVLLGQLGLYPSEAEMELVTKAARNRVNFTALTRYLRFCKREFESAAAAAASSNRGGSSSGSGPGSASVAAAQLAFSGSAARGPRPDDEDTLRAFVGLGGNEDGTGEVSTALLADVVRNFQLTIDMAGMIASVDVNHSGALDYREFCRLWSIPDDALRRNSLNSISALGNESNSFYRHSAMGGANGGGSTNWSAMAASHQQLVASCRNSIHQLPHGPTSRRKSSLVTTPALALSPIAGAKSRVGAGAGGNNKTVNHSSGGGGNAPAALQPLNEEERLLLVRMYLMPEPTELNTRKARVAVPKHGGGDAAATAGNDSGRLPPISGGDGSRLRVATAHDGGANRRNSPRRTKANAHGDGAEDVFSLQKSGNGVYQPPSPMILFQRNSAARRTRTGKGSGNNKNGTVNGRKTAYSRTAPASHMSNSASCALPGANTYMAAGSLTGGSQ